jgi:MFS family permease
MTDRDNFLVFAAVGGVLICAGGSYRPMVKKRSEAELLKFGVVAMMVGLTGIGTVAYLAAPPDAGAGGGLKVLFYAAMAVSVIGFAYVNPSVSALVSKRADPARQGEVQGVNQAFASLGRILGPFLGLVLFKAESSHTLPYLAGVLTLLVVVALLPRVRSRSHKS